MNRCCLAKHGRCLFFNKGCEGWIDDVKGVKPLFFAVLLLPAVEAVADLFDGFMPHRDGFENLLLSQKLARPFDHQHSVFCSSKDKVEGRYFLLIDRGVDNKCVLHQAYAHSANGFDERDVREAQSSRRGTYGEYIRRVGSVV